MMPLVMNKFNAIAAGVMLLSIAGCSVFPTKSIVTQPVTARPKAAPPAPQANGAIYQTATYRPILEDRRARYVGDTLVVVISENINASKTAESQAQKTGSLGASVPTIQGLPGKSFQGASVSASSDNKFDGKGGSSASNVFTGTISVTVLEILPNGNLLVGGEKKIALAQGTETIRITGVINPITIGAGNTVQSSQIADARIEYKGDGYIQEAQDMGWLARFFLNVLPF